MSAAYSPDGMHLAIGGKTLRILDVNTGTIRSFPVDPYVREVRFSPDGRWIADLAGDEAQLRAAVSGALAQTFKQGAGFESGMNFVDVSADGTLVATAGDDHTARISSATTGALLHILNGHDQRVVQVRFLPDAQRIASGTLNLGHVEQGFLASCLRTLDCFCVQWGERRCLKNRLRTSAHHMPLWSVRAILRSSRRKAVS
jgi:WD40 repeat protein